MDLWLWITASVRWPQIYISYFLYFKFQVFNALKSFQHEHLKVFYNKDIKDRWFFKNHRRIPPIYLTTEPGWYIVHVSYTPNGYIVPANFGVHFLHRMKNVPKRTKLHLNEIDLTNTEFCKSNAIVVASNLDFLQHGSKRKRNRQAMYTLCKYACTIYEHIYLKPLKTQPIKVLFFSFITKSHALFMFQPASLSHENVRAKHEGHCALRLKILVKNVKIVSFLFNPS